RERRVGREPDAVRARHGAFRERGDDDFDVGAAQDVDDGHGLELFEAFGERYQHPLHAGQPPSGTALAVASVVWPVFRKATASRISGSCSPVGSWPTAVAGGSGSSRSGSMPRW